MISKICSKCKEEKSLNYFSLNKSKKSGYSAECKECHKISRKKHYDNNSDKEKARTLARKKDMKNVFNDFKNKLSCQLCNEDHVATLHFHHLDPNEKEANISFAIHAGWSLLRIQQELSKCLVLCANCHMKEHYELLNNNSLVKHLQSTLKII